jgi:very-short-patch-repair endonuclease
MTEAFNQSSQKARRRSLRKTMPKAEQLLWSQLRNKRLGGYKFHRQYSVDQYILDFYCPKTKLGIEVDGPSHFLDFGIKKDDQRTVHMETYGIQVVRFTNNNIYENMDEVLNHILNRLTQLDNSSSG